MRSITILQKTFFLAIFTAGFFHLSSASAADYNGAQVGLFTPWSFISAEAQDLLTRQALKTQSDVDHLDLSVDPLLWHLANLHWELSANYKLTALTPQSLHLQADNLHLTLTIQHMDVNQYIERVINGVIVRVLVQAQCGPVVLTQASAQANANLGFQISGLHVTTSLDSLTVQWPAQSWQVNDIPCQGPVGFDKTLRDQLIDALKTADKVKPWAQTVLSQKIQEEANALVAEVAAPIALPIPQSPIPLQLTLEKLQSETNGVLATGALVWGGKSADGIRPVDFTRLPSAVTDTNAPVLLTSTAAWNDLIDAQLAARPNPIVVNLNQYSFFTRVLDSRLIQTFVWPDLWNYSKSSPFNLLIHLPTRPSLRWQNDGSALFNVSTTAWIQSLREGRRWDYINFQGQAQGHLIPKISQGRLSVTATVANSHFSAAFAPDYVATFQPNTCLSSALISNLQQVGNQRFSYSAALPPLNMGPVGTALFNGWKIAPESWVMVPMLVERPGQRLPPAPNEEY